MSREQDNVSAEGVEDQQDEERGIVKSGPVSLYTLRDTSPAAFLEAAQPLAQLDRDSIYVIDLIASGRGNEILRVASPAGGDWFDIPAAAVEDIFYLGLNATNDPARPLVAVILRKEFASLKSLFRKAAAPRIHQSSAYSARGRFVGYPQQVGRGRVEIRHRSTHNSLFTQAELFVPQLPNIVVVRNRAFTFTSNQEQEILLQLRNIPENGDVWEYDDLRVEDGPGGSRVWRWVFFPADVTYTLGGSGPGTTVELRMARLRCEEQTEGGDDEVYIEVSGRVSDGTPISRRLPAAEPASWELRDDQEPREIRNITLWVGQLSPGDFAEVIVTVKERDHGGGSDETPGAIRCFVRNNSGSITVRGEAAFANTSGGGCAALDGQRVQRFDLRNDGGHYILDLIAPGTC